MQFWWEGAALCWQWIEWLGIFAKIDSLGFSFLPFTFSKLQRQMRQGWNIAGTQPPQLSLWGGGGSPPALDWCHHHPPISPQLSHPPPWPPHPPTPTEQIYILFLTSCFQGGRSQWQWLVIWICLLCLKFLSNLIPLIQSPPLLLIVCGLPPSPTHGCWRIAMKGSFIHPLSLTPITIITHIHPKDLSLFALSPKKGGGSKRGEISKEWQEMWHQRLSLPKRGEFPTKHYDSSLEVCVWIKVKQMSSVDI